MSVSEFSADFFFLAESLFKYIQTETLIEKGNIQLIEYVSEIMLIIMTLKYK